MNTQKLSPKENTLFRSIVKYYETKQYKKGLKTADSILKKVPDHGETLAMKGLTLNCMGRKEEAYDFVRKGLKNNLRSHVCWHVYGLLYRSDRNYLEAIKCYRNAIRIDPENLQILRDLYLLQIQMRDLKGFADTRRKVLTLKPNNRNNWVGFSIAQHLNGNNETAIEIIDKYISTLEKDRPIQYEDSEIMLYRNELAFEAGDFEGALKHLEQFEDRIVDKVFFQQRKAEYLVLLNRFDDAMVIYEQLIDINPECYPYHRGIQCCFLRDGKYLNTLSKCQLPSNTASTIAEISDESRAEMIKYYSNKLVTADRKCLVWRRFLLDFTQGEEFNGHLYRYLVLQLSRGVPSLGADLKALYCTEFDANKAKVETIERLVESIVASLKQSSSPPCFPTFEENSVVEQSSTLEEMKTQCKTASEDALVWTLYFAAQHYDRLLNHVKALECIEECIKLSPTVLDFLQRKGRILKHMGDLSQAAAVMVEARKLDLADRYINNKATEYLFHNNQVEEADGTIALFTRFEGDPQQNLYDMQCMWYEIESGKSLLRLKEMGKALKKFKAVEKHFNNFEEDQFDFHSYCIRKMTLRTYISMLKLEDGLYDHEFFREAAKEVIKCYLTIFDTPEVLGEDHVVNAVDLSKLSPEERKKMKRKLQKQRKAEFKKKQQSEDDKKTKGKSADKDSEKEKEEDSSNNSKKKTNVRKGATVDPDPFGEELVKHDPLVESFKMVEILKKYSPTALSTHLLAFDVAIRKKKFLQALQALLCAIKIPGADVEHSQVFDRIVRFFVDFSDNLDSINPVVRNIISKKQSLLLDGEKDVASFVDSKKGKLLSSSLSSRFAVCKGLYMMKAKEETIAKEIVKLEGKDVTWKNCLKVLNFIRNVMKNEKLASDYQQACAKQFPLSTLFSS